MKTNNISLGKLQINRLYSIQVLYAFKYNMIEMLQKKTALNIVTLGYLIRRSFVKTLISKAMTLQSVVLARTHRLALYTIENSYRLKDLDLMARFYELPEQYSHCAFKAISVSYCECKPCFRMMLKSFPCSERVLFLIYTLSSWTVDYSNLCA